MLRAVRKKHADLVLTFFLFLFLVLSVTHMHLISEGVLSALNLCARAIIPTLFPFLVVTDLLLSAKGAKKLLRIVAHPLAKLLRLSDLGGTVVLLGAFFGFPMGAKAVAHYYSCGQISKEESERLLLFSGNASPFFLIGAVGSGLLSSLKKGVIIYLIQITVSLSCGFLLGVFSHGQISPLCEGDLFKKKLSFSRTVQNAVMQSLFISGYVVFFSAILAIMLPYVKHPFLSRLFASFLEIGNACALASQSKEFPLPFCAFSACFSGLSVYFQTLDCIEDTNLETRRYLPIKLLCGVLGFHIALLFR